MTPGRVRRAAAAALTTCLLAALLVAGVGQTAASTARAAAGSTATRTPSSTAGAGVRVTLSSVGPTSLTPGSVLSVRAIVRNGTDAPLRAAAVQLRVREQLLSTRAALDDWVEARTATGPVRVVVPVTEPIAPGGARLVALDVPADQLGLPSSPFDWGPRGFALELLDGDNELIATARSFVVWEPAPGGYEPTRISIVLPLTDGAPDIGTGRFADDALETLTGPGGRLRAVLDAAALPGVTWALDPALLGVDATEAGTGDGGSQAGGGSQDGGSQDGGSQDGGSQDGGDGGTASGETPDGASSPAPGAPGEVWATQWRTALRQAAPGHEIVALPYGDPDVNAVAHAGERQIYDLAEQHGRDAVQQLLGVPARTDVAWPVSGTTDATTLAMLVDAGRSAVMLSGGAHPPAEPITSTPTGRSRIPVGTSVAAGLLVDTPLSAALGRVGPGDASPDGADGADTQPQKDGRSEEDRGATGAVQRLLAETAAITLERPFDPRHVLVAAPRGWDPDAAAAVAAVHALTTAPWLQVHPLGDLVDTDPPDVERSSLRYPEADREAELPASGLRQAAAALDRIRRASTVLADPEPVVAGAELSVVAAASAAWRDRLQDWRAQLATFTADAAARETAVSALAGSGVTVVSSNVSLPVTLQNTLAEDASIRVRLRPLSSRLVVDNGVLGVVTVPAHSQRRFAVPVQAVGNGNTDVRVEVLTPTGQRLGAPVTMTVRVRADWESRGTLAVAVLVGLVLLVGVVRGIRRGRRRRTQDLPAGVPTGLDRAERDA